MNATTEQARNDTFLKNKVFTQAEEITLQILFVLISVGDIAGNSMVCYVILKYKQIQNTVNLLLLNLSIADIVCGLSILPYAFISIPETRLSGRAADLMCGFTDGQTLFFAASQVNLLTLAILSISRYTLINHPLKLKWRLKKRAVKWLALVTWLLGLSLLIPSGISFNYNPNDGICWRQWARGVNPIAYFVATLILGMAVPLLSLTFTYMSTIYTLWFKKSTRRLARSNSRSGVQTHRKRISVLLGLLIVAYLLCWMPFGIYWLLSAALNYFPDTVEGQIQTMRITRITILVALLNTCLDPIVYAMSNRQIKNGAMKTFRGGRNTNTVDPTGTDC
eukprot:gene9246-10222_t